MLLIQSAVFEKNTKGRCDVIIKKTLLESKPSVFGHVYRDLADCSEIYLVVSTLYKYYLVVISLL